MLLQKQRAQFESQIAGVLHHLLYAEFSYSFQWVCLGYLLLLELLSLPMGLSAACSDSEPQNMARPRAAWIECLTAPWKVLSFWGMSFSSGPIFGRLLLESSKKKIAVGRAHSQKLGQKCLSWLKPLTPYPPTKSHTPWRVDVLCQLQICGSSLQCCLFWSW